MRFAILLLTMLLATFLTWETTSGQSAKVARGLVRVEGRSLVDDRGPFLGLGASYFTALHRCRNDRERLESDLAFLESQGFNYYRMLSMVGWYGAWEGREIAPCDFTSREGKQVAAWPDYWEQLGELIDLAYDRYGLRTQVTLFADAQLMPGREERRQHVDRFLREIVPGREEKILLVEVANEAWQNGFEGDEGVRDLKHIAKTLKQGTKVPVALTSNHHDSFDSLYKNCRVDLATWHFSRDRRRLGGWQPVVDCWGYALRPGCPPVVSNEPIGPGSSVDAEREPVKLASAAAFAYVAGLPAYVFHCEAGVFGKTRFEETPGVDCYRKLLPLLPADLPSWTRNDGLEPSAPLTVFAGDRSGEYLETPEAARRGCVRNAGCRQGKRFVALPIGIANGGLELEARGAMALRAYDPLTGETLVERSLAKGERLTLPQGPGALLLVGKNQ